MSTSGYGWRRLTAEQRRELLAWRQANKQPWHSPPHRPNFDDRQFHVTAACYEHVPHIGRSRERMDAFACDLLDALGESSRKVLAWCLLPNHYHALVETRDVLRLLHDLGQLHGRTSHAWNGEDDARGRRVFFRAVDRTMRTDSHVLATLNYVHHNAVHHGYAARWTEWPWSSAAEYLERTGEAEAERLWRRYPLRAYGKGWDDPEM